MNEKLCPVCGSDNITGTIDNKVLIEPFICEKTVETVNYKCALCGESGDFFDDNEEILYNAIELLKQESVKNIIDDFSLNKISMASIERALELPQRTLTKWKNGRTKPSATVITLLKFLRIFPWLLEVAENKFDYSTAQKIHIENAVNKLLASLSFDKNEFINKSNPVSASAEFNISTLLHPEEKVRRLPIISAQYLVLAVVRRRNKFLFIFEQKPKNGWYLPAGKVEPGEDFVEAVRRETLEEAGIPIEVDGIVRFECLPDNAGMRLIFSASPADDTPPKSEPDKHSLKADWFTVDEIKKLTLRDPDVLKIFSYVTRSGFVAPLSILAREGDPFD